MPRDVNPSSVPAQIVSMQLKDGLKTDAEKALLENFQPIHESNGDVATPRHFFTFIDNFQRLGGNRQAQLVEQQSFLANGLSKLADAAKTVAELTGRAEKSRKLLKVKQQEAEEALTSIQSSIVLAAERRTEVCVHTGTSASY
jgi:hypothetical protein